MTESVADDAERQLFQRVLDALLREDHLGLASNGRRSGRGWWLTPLVKVVADAGAEAGRLRELPDALRRWRVGGGAEVAHG